VQENRPAPGPRLVAIQEVDETGSPVTWREHVTDEEYRAAPDAHE
jgi:hypothetical protein